MVNREKLYKQLKNLMRGFADPLDGNKPLYHYTSASGLRGIVGSYEIWLTNTAFVNDTTECKALKNEKELFEAQDFTNDHVKNAWFRYIRLGKDTYTYYIISFSKAKNSLEQWRAYGSYSIGFEACKLAKSNFNLYECVYDKEKIKDWILEKEKGDDWNGDCLDEQAKWSAAFNLIYAASMKYKNEHYENEEEVRLITVSNHTWEPYPNSPGIFEGQPAIHCRDHPVYNVPFSYVKFFLSTDKQEQDEVGETEAKKTEEQLKRIRLDQETNEKRELLPIREIQIGPMVHQKEAQLACKILLSEKGYKNCEVVASEIPYRGF